MVGIVNRVWLNTATTGTGPATLGSPVAGYQTMANAGATDGSMVEYTFLDANNAFEVGFGIYNSAGPTISRLLVHDSSNADTFITLSGSATVFITPTASIINAAAVLMFGTGADGNVTIASGTTTLVRDMCYNNLTITAGTLATNGFRVFVAGVLDLTGATITSIIGTGTSLIGGNAAGATAGVPGALVLNGYWGFPGAVGLTGGLGNATTGTVGVNAAASLLAIGGRGGPGGAGGSGVANPGRTGGTQPVWANITLNMPIHSGAAPINVTPSSVSVRNIQSGGPGAGGGSGGGDGTNAAGGGGAGGSGPSSIIIYARFINRSGATAAAAIQNNGGAGGTGGAAAAVGTSGGGGGGGGGGAGGVYIVYEELIGSVATNAIQCNGAAGGAGGNGFGTGLGGAGGTGGNAGGVQLLGIGRIPSFTASTWNTAGTAASVPATVTGSAGGAGATLQFNL